MVGTCTKTVLHMPAYMAVLMCKPLPKSQRGNAQATKIPWTSAMYKLAVAAEFGRDWVEGIFHCTERLPPAITPLTKIQRTLL